MTSAAPTDIVSAMNDSSPTPSIPTIQSECIEDSETDQMLFEFMSLQGDDILSNQRH